MAVVTYFKTIYHSGEFTDQIRGYKGKRAFDILFAAFALITLVFVFIFAAIAVRLSSRGPVLFSHSRVGMSGEIFGCLKFRTMNEGSEDDLAKLLADPELAAEFDERKKLRNDPRIIPGIGHFLRKSSLDEIPQFINVLIGDMSVVGPRPVTVEEMHRYGKHQSEYLSVRPGITGAWQVSGRSALDFEERVAIDADYVENMSFFNDLAIITRTVWVVVMQKDAY